MGADVIFAIVADVLGVPTLVVGLWIDRRAKSDRRATHLRRLLVIVEALDRAAMRFLAIKREIDGDLFGEADLVRLLAIARNLDQGAMAWLPFRRRFEPLSDVDAERIADAGLLVQTQLDKLRRERHDSGTPQWMLDIPLDSYLGLTRSYIVDELHPSLERAIGRLAEALGSPSLLPA